MDAHTAVSGGADEAQAGRAPDYDPAQVEARWRAAWETARVANVADDALDGNHSPTAYVLEMLPYPSGRLHMGHVKNYTMGDVITHYRRRNGARVLHPMGYDSFGLPAENAAIKTGGDPLTVTEGNIAGIEQDFAHMGWSIDWDRKLATHRPDYYRWTQDLFLRFFERGLAYQKDAPVNWCPVDQTVLANEQVVDGACERCGTLVERRNLRQWYLRITDYAQALLDDMDLLEQWPERVLTMQRNWIGRSEGAIVTFRCAALETDVRVFTTRPDTLFGATFFVLAPEHPLVGELVAGTSYEQRVGEYVANAAKLSSIERSNTDREKTGVPTGRFVVNPVNQQAIPVFVADYVLPDYGEGALMAVPAHDERDFGFAQQFELPVREVVVAPGGEAGAGELPFAAKEGTLTASGQFTGMPVAEAQAAIITWLAEQELGEGTVNFRLRDWLISRQRYWGCPIPIVHCDACGAVAVPADQLPVELPEVEDYAPRGKSPLASNEEFVATTCPQCGGAARRETDTMDTFVDSSWYFLRYADPHNDTEPFSREIVDRWLPVDQYIGGIEHAVLHLLYARFFTKVLHDLGMVGFREPFANLFTQGMIYYQGAKMSKSKGNVVEPLPYVEQFGADALRTYILFLGPPDQDAEWQDTGIQGTKRFLDRVWRLTWQVAAAAAEAGGDALEIVDCPSLEELSADADARELAAHIHEAIAKVGADLGTRFSFNTAIAALMEATNLALRVGADLSEASDVRLQTLRFACQSIVSLVQPVAPHIACELWETLGGRELWAQPWPQGDEAYTARDTVTIAVQVNGKLRAQVEVPADADKDAVLAAAKANERVSAHLEGKRVVKEIVVPGRLANIVVAG
jgi:leucyl-tRNA synthetase